MQIDRLLAGSGQDNWQLQTIWLDEQDQRQKIWSALNMPNMTGTPRAIILRHCESVEAAFWKDISPNLKGFKPKIWPFFCFESAWDKGKPKIPAPLKKTKYYKYADNKKWIWEYPGLNHQNIRRYVEQKCQDLGLSIPSTILGLLCENLPKDSAGIDNELEKIALLAHHDNTITKEHLRVISWQPDIDIFAFLKQVQSDGDIASAWNKIFSEKLKGQEMLYPFIGLLLRETRILWLLATGQGNKARIHPAYKNQKANLARKLGLEKISALWDMLLDADVGVKSGNVPSEQAMEKLTAGLFKLFSNRN